MPAIPLLVILAREIVSRESVALIRSQEWTWTGRLDRWIIQNGMECKAHLVINVRAARYISYDQGWAELGMGEMAK